jgi:hypothetical protein
LQKRKLLRLILSTTEASEIPISKFGSHPQNLRIIFDDFEVFNSSSNEGSNSIQEEEVATEPLQLNIGAAKKYLSRKKLLTEQEAEGLELSSVNLMDTPIMGSTTTTTGEQVQVQVQVQVEMENANEMEEPVA